MNKRLAITDPAEGLMVYQTDSIKGFWFWNGTAWENKISDLSLNTTLASKQYTKGNKVIFSSSAQWTCPRGIDQITVELWGAGGGGGGGTAAYYPCNNTCGGKGGKGGYTKSVIQVTPGTTFTISIGSGGAGGSEGKDGLDGENSLFSNQVVANGGKGGKKGYCNWPTQSNGENGQNGTVTNFTYSTGDSRTYIPTSFLTIPGLAAGGNGTCCPNGICSTTAGEAGYCIISY